MADNDGRGRRGSREAFSTRKTTHVELTNPENK